MFEIANDLFSRTCHQLGDRCLVFGDQPFSLCARCAGLYVGFGIVALWLMWHWLLRWRPWVAQGWLRAAFAALALCLVDGLSGASHLFNLGNGTRFCLGYAAGLGAALLLVTLLPPWFPERRCGKFTESGAWLAIPWGVPVLIPLVQLPWLGNVLTYVALGGLISSRVLVFFGVMEVIRRATVSIARLRRHVDCPRGEA